MSASESTPDPTPEATADERLLIDDARKQRNRQRSGFNFIITLAVGAVSLCIFGLGIEFRISDGPLGVGEIDDRHLALVAVAADEIAEIGETG